VKSERKVNDATLDKIKSILESSHKVKVGILSGAYEDGTPVAYVAAIQEFGSPEQNIPPRSFMRSTVTEKSTEWSNKYAKILMSGNPDNAAEVLGQVAAGDVREKIATIQDPPLQESTIKARVRSMADNATVGALNKPLVQTGLLLGSISHEVTNA